MITFRRFIKNLDIFGHRIELNFDQKGNTHQTMCGGFTSIVVVMLLVLLTLSKFLNMPGGTDIIDFLSWVGGLFYFFFIFIDFIIAPVARHSFVMRALKRLYFVRTDKPATLGLSTKVSSRKDKYKVGQPKEFQGYEEGKVEFDHKYK